MSNLKMVRVELELENGEIYRLTGEQAEKWKEITDGQAVLNHAHGMQFPQFDWDIFSKPSPQTTDWCPTCKQGWECSKRDQESRIELHEMEERMRTGSCSCDTEGRTICPAIAKLEIGNRHTHKTPVGLSGPPIYTETGHKHELPVFVYETGEEIDNS